MVQGPTSDMTYQNDIGLDTATKEELNMNI